MEHDHNMAESPENKTNGFLDWFTGGTDYDYRTLIHCMDHDLISITLVILLCIGVFSGYMVIAYRWSKASKEVPESEAKNALQDLKWIFLICGVCGYLWILIDSVWPAWRLYMIALALLNFFTWRYVIRVDSLDRIYRYLKDRDDLIKEIEAKQSEIERLERAKY